MEVSTRAGTALKDNKTIIPKNSLLGLPAEVRVAIYQHLFEGRKIRALVTTRTEHEASQSVPQTKAVDGESTMIDDGITLTCKSLRAETVPVLRQTLSLHCCFDSDIPHPVELLVKSELLESIREAHFISGAPFDIPYLQLLNLETLYVELQDDCGPIDVATEAEWAATGDLTSLMEEAKHHFTVEAQDYQFCDALKNPDRKFKIIWRDQIDLRDPNEVLLIENMWFTFDWDTLEVTEGVSGIQLAYSKMKQ